MIADRVVIYELSPRLNIEATLMGWDDRFPEHSIALAILASCGADALSEDAFQAQGIGPDVLNGMVELGAFVRVVLPEGEPEPAMHRFLRVLDGGRA